MDNLELICFQMISNAGMAKSTFVEAMQEAEAGNFDAAQTKIEEGKNFLVTGHGVHAGLIQKEAAGEKTDLTLLLMHAEDQLLSCETLEIMAERFFAQAKRLAALEAAASQQ
ncbi:PTS lactose/cellobiose transporter subunit IIA [Faecalibaculum rodentium]|uniref:PTS lactose/cellobiose transporter subunit IIA n=1 Tax=Faecalibaculum rodentium TaxID=1702221 RepID=UPI00263BA7D7|nr:PTS lactose/cellobiose transporter subunit IIA [Faecalibaculum rodentium]